MTLFRKTLLFFVGVIAFQAVLTILLVTNVTRRANLSDARREIEEEATILYDGYNAWKRQMWISLVGAGSDAPLSRAVALHPVPSLKERLLESKVDALVVRRERVGVVAIEQTLPGSLELRDIDGLTRARAHPYITLSMLGGTLCLVGTTPLAPVDGRGADLFLLKRLDPDFCAQLVRNRKSQVSFLLGKTVLSSTLGGAAGPGFFDPALMGSAYREMYDQRMAGTSWNAAFQKLGTLDQAQDGEELYLATFLSNEPYDERLLQLDRTILVVSLAGAFLTIALSLFLSRNITHPIAELHGAMGRIGGGALETSLTARGGYEISRLFRGFNDMAAELARNRGAITKALRESVLLKEYNETIVDSIRAGICIVNRDLVVERANNAFIETFGLERAQVLGLPLTCIDLDIVDEAIVEKILAVFSRGEHPSPDTKRSRDGRVFDIRLSPFYSTRAGVQEESSGCVFMVDDISAKTRLEQRILQAEKLATVSMLSAGMAHEINNPLGSILTNVQNLIDEETSPPRSVSLKWIEQETRRIARIVQGMLSFSATGTGSGSGADLNEVVRDVVSIMGHAARRDGSVRVDMRLAPDLPRTVVGTDELKQVVINLLANATQAISGSGRVLITTRAARGDRLCLAVADTGGGIAPQVLPRIFDPFFTTKRNGEGTGLGLSVVYGIVTRYAGTIDVKSAVGGGARFCLHLPAARGEEPA